MSSPPNKARTLDEVINGLSVEDQARVATRASELVTEVLHPQDQGSPQASHDEESPIMSEPLSPIDMISIPGPNSMEVELRPITVLLGDNNSGKSWFTGLLLNLVSASTRHGWGGPWREGDDVLVNVLSVRCSGEWTQVALYDSAHDGRFARVIEDGDVNPLAVPDEYPVPQLSESLIKSLKAIRQVGTPISQVLDHEWGAWAASGDVRADAVADDLRRLGVVDDVKFLSHDGCPEYLFPRLVVGSVEDAPLLQVAGGTKSVIRVLMVLRSAVEGQLVLIHNPEAGLHPRAVIALTGVLVEAARRGVRLIVETQSTTIVRALQLAVAEDDSGWVRDNLALYWFDRTGGGAPKVTMADVQADGSFGEWPYDLSTVELDLTRSLLVASHRRRAMLQALAKGGL